MITVAIPFYNAEKFLAKAIDSVLNQTYKDFELILLDDGSTDSSLNIAEKYAKLDGRIKVYSDGFNKNLGYRLNQIPALVKTEYLARMDADDVMHPMKLEKQLEILEKRDDIDVLGTNAFTINSDNKVVGIRMQPSQDIVKVKSFIHPTIMARTQWFLDNPYDVDAVRMEDAELWFRTSHRYSFYVTKEPLFFYREFGCDYYKKYFATYKSRKYILNKYKNNKTWRDFFIKMLIKSYVYCFFNLISQEQFLINRRNEVLLNKKKEISDLL